MYSIMSGGSRSNVKRLLEEEKAMNAERLHKRAKHSEENVISCVAEQDDVEEGPGNDNYLYNSQNVESCTNQCEAKFDQLKETVADLKNNIDKLQATILTQNTVIMEALATQIILTEKLLGQEKYQANLAKAFPIKTTDDLAEVNNKIKEVNRTDFVHCLSLLLKGQLHKTLTDIFSMDVIVASNVDGIHGKLPLKQFKQLFDVLLDAIRSNGEEDPEKALRNAFKLVKKRHFQSVCVNKKKETIFNKDNDEGTSL